MWAGLCHRKPLAIRQAHRWVRSPARGHARARYRAPQSRRTSEPPRSAMRRNSTMRLRSRTESRSPGCWKSGTTFHQPGAKDKSDNLHTEAHECTALLWVGQPAPLTRRIPDEHSALVVVDLVAVPVGRPATPSLFRGALDPDGPERGVLPDDRPREAGEVGVAVQERPTLVEDSLEGEALDGHVDTGVRLVPRALDLRQAAGREVRTDRPGAPVEPRPADPGEVLRVQQHGRDLQDLGELRPRLQCHAEDVLDEPHHAPREDLLRDADDIEPCEVLARAASSDKDPVGVALVILEHVPEPFAIDPLNVPELDDASPAPADQPSGSWVHLAAEVGDDGEGQARGCNCCGRRPTEQLHDDDARPPSHPFYRVRYRPRPQRDDRGAFHRARNSRLGEPDRVADPSSTLARIRRDDARVDLRSQVGECEWEGHHEAKQLVAHVEGNCLRLLPAPSCPHRVEVAHERPPELSCPNATAKDHEDGLRRHRALAHPPEREPKQGVQLLDGDPDSAFEAVKAGAHPLENECPVLGLAIGHLNPGAAVGLALLLLHRAHGPTKLSNEPLRDDLAVVPVVDVVLNPLLLELLRLEGQRAVLAPLHAGGEPCAQGTHAEAEPAVAVLEDRDGVDPAHRDDPQRDVRLPRPADPDALVRDSIRERHVGLPSLRELVAVEGGGLVVGRPQQHVALGERDGHPRRRRTE
eukprot:4838018-Pyramimonas_sp.AAC.3